MKTGSARITITETDRMAVTFANPSTGRDVNISDPRFDRGPGRIMIYTADGQSSRHYDLDKGQAVTITLNRKGDDLDVKPYEYYETSQEAIGGLQQGLSSRVSSVISGTGKGTSWTRSLKDLTESLKSSWKDIVRRWKARRGYTILSDDE
jgi:hypothetical protein